MIWPFRTSVHFLSQKNPYRPFADIILSNSSNFNKSQTTVYTIVYFILFTIKWETSCLFVCSIFFFAIYLSIEKFPDNLINMTNHKVLNETISQKEQVALVDDMKKLLRTDIKLKKKMWGGWAKKRRTICHIICVKAQFIVVRVCEFTVQLSYEKLLR